MTSHTGDTELDTGALRVAGSIFEKFLVLNETVLLLFDIMTSIRKVGRKTRRTACDEAETRTMFWLMPPQCVTVTGFVAQVAEDAAYIETVGSTDAHMFFLSRSAVGRRVHRVRYQLGMRVAPDLGSLIMILRPVMDERSTKHGEEASSRPLYISEGLGLKVPTSTCSAGAG